ncbi:MAG: hypothetical protein ACP5TE_14235, partial [Verrucomicrobiia bacterium]
RGIVFSQPVHSIVTLSKMRLYFDRLWNQSLSSMLMIQDIVKLKEMAGGATVGILGQRSGQYRGVAVLYREGKG